MTNENIEKIKELYKELENREKLQSVYSIFKDFFGEDLVDLQCSLDERAFFSSLTNTHVYDLLGYSTMMESQEFKELPEEVRTDFRENTCSDSCIRDMKYLPYFIPFMKKSILEGKDEFLDLHYSIIVHFPHVRVTNDFDKYVDIKHLWAKVPVTLNGKGGGAFYLLRSEYQRSHLNSDYMFSHCQGISHNPSEWRNCCYGKGPIKSTLASLACSYDPALWQLFCLELSKYVTVESNSGIPYRYLERIYDTEMSREYVNATLRNKRGTANLPKKWFKEFLRYVMNKEVLQFNYINGEYGIAMSYYELRILLSNLFIEWFNKMRGLNFIKDVSMQHLINTAILERAACKDLDFYTVATRQSNKNYTEGARVLTFKGNPVTLHVVDDLERNNNLATLLHPDVIMNIIKAILYTTNFLYGNYNNETSKIDKKVIYV